MGEEKATMIPLSHGTLFMREKDGRMIKFGAFETVEEFSSSEGWETIGDSPIFLDRNCSFTVTIPRSFHKRLINYAIYGWRAKGPVRKRKIFDLVYGKRRRAV